MFPNATERILWKQNEETGGAIILRVFASSPILTIPRQINGCLVTELGNYCFAPKCQLPKDGVWAPDDFPHTSVDTQADLVELSGNYLQQVILPETVSKIGDYAFYNCRSLISIEFAGQLHIIGSDVFMNCHKLRHMFIRCMPSQPSALRQMLAQISWDIEVSFCGCTSCGDHTQIQASIFYPEYYETYDEIAPAHVFGRNIVGEGFRARHCFTDERIDFVQYDTIFQKSCAEESEQTVCRLVLCRLRYPIGLSAKKRLQYESYIKIHGKAACKWLVDEKTLDGLSFLFHQRLLSPEDAQYAILLATDANWAEGSASMIRWRQLLPIASAHKKYQFDAF